MQLALDPAQGIWPQLAEHLLQQHGHDMSQVAVVVPDSFQQDKLRHALQQSSNQALLLPHVTTLNTLADNWQADGYTRLNNQQCIVLLANELKYHKKLYGKGSRWGLANDLLRLFRALTRQHIQLSDEAGFLSELNQHAPQNFHWLSQEGRLVYRLWQAWHEQLKNDQLLDPDNAYTQGLERHSQEPRFDSIYWLKGPSVEQCDLHWWQQCQQHTRCIEVTLAPITSQQAHFSYMTADSGEQQALMVTGATSRALHRKQTPVYIITEDRKLTRRIRALLERLDITADDKSGWGLSTTQAAACIEHWLLCIEQNFHYQALLDFLKSPYSLPDIENKSQLTHLLEQNIIHRENISANLKHYRNAIKHRRHRLNSAPSEAETQLLSLLQRLQQASTELLKLRRRPQTAVTFFSTLNASLEQLGVLEQLTGDAAGQLILEALQQLPEQGQSMDLTLDWEECRQWLNLILEQSSFRPAVSESSVVILNHRQSLWVNEGYAILCAMEQQHYPPRPAPVPFFGEAVRRQLGLTPHDHTDEAYFNYLQQQLYGPGNTLLCWQKLNDGEPVSPANWVEQALRQQADPDSLYDQDLLSWLPDIQPFSGPQYLRPQVQVQSLLPDSETVSAYQRLVHCPYLYFVHDLLNLGALDEIREALEKSDYGSRVHACLEAFHRQVPGLPAPFPEKLHSGNREQALAHLNQLSRQVFADDTQHHFEHRSWLKRWLNTTPAYIDWEIKRQSQWTPRFFEKLITPQTEYDLPLRGRIDRVDHHGEDADSYALIDYKTGTPPSKANILAGEDIQLSTYAFTVEHVSSVSYLAFDSHKVREVKVDEELPPLVEAVKQRYIDIRQSLAQGTEITAWGEQSWCERCRNAGICRRQLWLEKND